MMYGNYELLIATFSFGEIMTIDYCGYFQLILFIQILEL